MAQARMKVIMIGELEIQVYPLKLLAAKMHRSANTVRYWEVMKMFPKPIVVTSDNMRWYTKDEIDVYTEIAEQEQIKNGKAFGKTKFVERVFQEHVILKKRFEQKVSKYAHPTR